MVQMKRRFQVVSWHSLPMNHNLLGHILPLLSKVLFGRYCLKLIAWPLDHSFPKCFGFWQLRERHLRNVSFWICTRKNLCNELKGSSVYIVRKHGPAPNEHDLTVFCSSFHSSPHPPSPHILNLHSFSLHYYSAVVTWTFSSTQLIPCKAYNEFSASWCNHFLLPKAVLICTGAGAF